MAVVPPRIVRWTLALSVCLAVAGPRTAHVSAQAAVKSPTRIVSLVPATTEMLFAMGAGDRLVGVGTYDRFPPEVARLPKLGGLLDPNIEQLIALRPDLVIVYETQTELRRQLERAHIPMWGYSIKGLADVTATMRALGIRVGAPAAAAEAERIDAGLERVRRRVAGQPRPRTLLVFGREPGSLRGINASGGYGYLHDLLELAGGTDVLADVKQAAVAASTEMILARAPEAIIELHDGEPWPAARLDAERRAWSLLPSVPAVRTGRVAILAGDEFVVPGPRVIMAAERLAQALHPGP